MSDFLVTVEEVEARLGFTLETSKAQALEGFLEDTAANFDAALEDRELTAVQIERAKRLILWRATEWYFASDRPRGISSLSQTVGDTSESMSFRSDGGNDPLDPFRPLTRREKALLGLTGAARITSFELYTDRKRRW